jgi:hypothetical protein
MTLPADHFASMYAADPDPWGFTSRWYERRKYDLTLAALPHPRYARAYEPGCSIGVLTQGLAARCDLLLAEDVAEAAVRAAQERTVGCPGVQVGRRAVPEEWPEGRWDLVVVSELAYFLDAADRELLWRRVEDSLLPGGTLLAVHWRPAVDGWPATGDQVHAELRRREGWTSLARHEEPDLLLDVLGRGAVPSVAQRTGLR